MQLKLAPDVKRAPVIMAKLFWQPFNTRFGSLLEQLSTHRNILKDELQLAHILIDAEDSIQTLRARETEVLERNTAEEARKLAYENRIQTEENMWKTAMDIYNTILDQLKVSDVRARETQLLTKEVKSHLEEEYKGMYYSRSLRLSIQIDQS